MNCTERDNYFSIYMKKKEHINKSKKNILGKPNKTLKNTNISNLNLHNEKSVKKIIFEDSGKKEKSSISIIRNNLFHDKNQKIISTNNLDDEEEKIDYLQRKIFNILDIIDKFKEKYFQKREEKENNNYKFINHNTIEKEKIIDRKINNKTKVIITTNNNIENKVQLKNTFIKKSKHQKCKSQFISEQKIKENLIKKRIEYSNLINKKVLKKNNKNLSQSQLFRSKKKINNNTSRVKKINEEIDNSSTREFSEKIYKGSNYSENKKSLKNVRRQNKIRGIKIKDFKYLTQLSNDNNKCISERGKRIENISKKYEFEIV